MFQNFELGKALKIVLEVRQYKIFNFFRRCLFFEIIFTYFIVFIELFPFFNTIFLTRINEITQFTVVLCKNLVCSHAKWLYLLFYMQRLARDLIVLRRFQQLNAMGYSLDTETRKVLFCKFCKSTFNKFIISPVLNIGAWTAYLTTARYLVYVCIAVGFGST